MTASVGFTSVEVAITEPQRPKVGYVGAEVLLQPASGVTVGFAAIQVITKLNPDTNRRITGETAEVIIKAARSTARVTGETAEVVLGAPTPVAYVSNQNVDVIMTGNPTANMSWMGTELLMSVAPAVQSNFSWMGLEFLVPAAPKISSNWIGLEMLVDVNLLDDLPDYLDYGDVYAIPGFDLYSYPLTISGLSNGTTITLYSYDDLKFSLDGNNFTNTISVQNNNQVYLTKHPSSIFSDTYLIYTESSFSGETEVGSWNLVGPSQAIMYDYNYASNQTSTTNWDNYTPVTDNQASIDAEYIAIQNNEADMSLPEMANFNVSEANAPIGEFANQTDEIKDASAPNSLFNNQTDEIKDALAPDSVFDDQTSEIKLAFAPMSLFKNTSSELKFAGIMESLFTSTRSYYETVESLRALFFNNGNLNIIAANSAQQKIEAFTFGQQITHQTNKFGFNYLTTRPADAIEGKIAVPLNWRTVATQMEIYRFDKLRLVDVYFHNPHLEDYKQVVEIPLYWISWENRQIMAQWVFENYNLRILIGMDWVKFSNMNFTEIDTDWMYQHLVEFHEFTLNSEYIPWIQGHYFNINLDAEFFNLATTVSYSLEPIIEASHKTYFINPLYSYQYAIDSLKTIDLNAVYDNDLIYNSTNYVRQGGYQTPQLAQDAASSYPTNITIVYQQPEGTYSYNVLYTNDVWCGDVPVKPVLKAIAWYLGGG